MRMPLPLDKHAWHPSLLPGQIVLVSTIDANGWPNVAPKSWVTMVAFEGPILAFGCNVRHRTYRNIRATGEFAVNVVPARLAEQAWRLSEIHGERRLRRCGLTPTPAQKIRAPLVDECPAHLECLLDDARNWGDEVLVFGRVVAASIDSDCLFESLENRYEKLAPTFFLEDGVYARLGAPVSVSRDATDRPG